MKQYSQELFRIIKQKRPDKGKLANLKIKLCKKLKLKKIPTDIQLLLNADAKDVDFLKKYLLTKPTRTISGVAVIAIMSYPYKCPQGACLMCPSKTLEQIPQSYTGKEPATMRAIRNRFDPYLQVMNRLEQYAVLGQNFDKVDLIIMGGTFPSFKKSYQESFIKYAFKAMNDFSKLFFKKDQFDFVKFKEFFGLPGEVGDPERTKKIHKKLSSLKKQKTTLHREQAKNEKAKIRCIGLTIETRPDYAKLIHANEFLRLGCTRVEIGVQSVYDDVLKKINRGHTVKDTVESIKTLKDLGFKINAHYMIGLPGSSTERDLKGLNGLVLNPDFRPDMLKIYPCMVVKDSELYKLWKKGKYKPISTKEAVEVIAEFKKTVPTWVRITRVQRDIPTYATEAGVDRTNLRQYVKELMNKNGTECRCIRCREAGHKFKNKEIKIKNIKILTKNYQASDGEEFFISAEDETNNILFGYCRLRFPSQCLRKEITKNSALIREIHVYSPLVSIGKKSKQSFQHKGIGKKLLETAEGIAKKHSKQKIVVISGIGARGYFRKFGYKKEGPYMTKLL